MDPNFLSSIPSQAEEAEELAISGLFDAAWYRCSYADVAQTDLEPVVHFVRHGWQEHRLPNPYFDAAWYLGNNPDVAAAGMNPLLHYLRHGDLEGRRPMPYFDPAWYRAAHDLAADRPALRHFLPRRHSGRFAPCATLYSVPFLAAYRAAAGPGKDPFRRYLDAMANRQQDAWPDLVLVEETGLLDRGYYLFNGSDVADAALDPALHYGRYGWQEKRNPNLYFDTGWYLATNEHVGRLGLNPLVHYICAGEAANRRPVPYFDPGWYRAAYGVPPDQNALAHYLAHRRSQACSPTPLFDVAWYVAKHREELGPHRDPFAHFLQAGALGDLDPSPQFNSEEYRRRYIGRVAANNPSGLSGAGKALPVVHFLISTYR